MDLIKKSNMISCLLICLIIVGSLALISSVSASELDNLTNANDFDGIKESADYDIDSASSIDCSSSIDSNLIISSDLENRDELDYNSNVENENNAKSLLKDSTDDIESEQMIIYVSINGNDSNSGLSGDDAFLTIENALFKAYESNMNSIIHISEGVYTSENYGYPIRSEFSVHLIGENANETILDGQGLHRILDVYTANVIIENLTFINGYDPNFGGAIQNQGNLTLINCNFLSNQVSSGLSAYHVGHLYGGAIYNSGTLIIENSSFENNVAGGIFTDMGSGGAIYNLGKLSINNTLFINNDIRTSMQFSTSSVYFWNALQKGAAIASYSDNVDISNCQFNQSQLKFFELYPDETAIFACLSAGGAIYFEGDNYTFTNCSFFNNTADCGGAIYFKGNNVKFDSCSFKNNSAFIGGAIMALDYNQNADWDYFHDLTSNHCSNLSIEDSIFENNFIVTTKIKRINFRIGYGAGAGFLKMDNISIINSSFKNNGLLDNYTSYYYFADNYCHGGALFLEGQNSLVDKSNFTNNVGEVGGAIMNYGFDTTVSNSFFLNNSACLLDGGAISHSIGDLIVDNCTFDSNRAYQNEQYVSSINFEGGSEYDSNAVPQNGGTIYASYDYTNNYIFEQKSVYNNSRFYNSQSEYGGAIFDTGNAVIFENLEFINNTAFYGGAVYKQGFSNVFRNSTFINNSALSKDYSNGGAIYSYGANLLIELCDFESNAADLYGGALFNFGESSNIINNSFISNNGFSGGSVYLSGTGGRFSENEVVSSFAVYGGGLYNAANNLICVNNSFSFCKANVSGGAIYNLVSTLQLYANNMENCQANLSGVGSGNYVFTCGNISYLFVSFLNSETVNMVDNRSVLLFANVTDNLGNPITGGNVSFIFFNGSDDGESTIIGTSELIEGIAYMKFNIPMELGSNYSISGSYSYGAEPISTQIGNLKSVLSTRIYLSSDMVDNKVDLGNTFNYEMILLDSLDNYLANAEVLVYLDGVYQKSVFTNDVGYLNETSSLIPISGKHYLNLIYEGDVFHNRGTAELNFTVYYNNTYYYDDIVIDFVDLAYSIVHTGLHSSVPIQFIIYHNETGEALANVSTYRYFKVYENGVELEKYDHVDYLGPVEGQEVLYYEIYQNGQLAKVFRTSPDGIFEFHAKGRSPGLYEYRIEFLGDLVKHYDPSTHNNINEEDNIYNPCNISFILLVDSPDSIISTNISYEGPNNFSEIDLPYYIVNLTDKDGNPLENREIRIYDNGSYLASVFTDGDGFAEYQFEESLDLGRHFLEFIFVGDNSYSSSYKIIDLDVFENPYKYDIVFSNKSSLNVTGPNNNLTVQLKDSNNNNLSNFTISITVQAHEFGHLDKSFSRNYTAVTDENGIFSIPLELGAGVYQINCSYAGDKWHRENYRIFDLNITKAHTLLLGQYSIDVLKNDSYLTVILTTDDLRVLSNYKITYYVLSGDYETIDDAKVVFYAFTNESSISRLKINLPVGKYMLFTSFEGDKWYDNCSLLTNLTIYGDASKLVADKNIIIKESGYYTVRLLDSNDNPIAGESINITVNGKSYTRMTDANGEARLEINLDYGNYTVTSKFNGNINYTSSVISSSLYVVDKNYKYPSQLKLNSSEIYRVNGVYDIILTGLNNESLIHKNIIVNVNGTNYTIRTNNDGLAHLDYDFTIGSYIITAYFMGDNDYQPSNITSTLTVVSENAANTILNSSVYYVLKGKGGIYTVTLLDKIGNPIAGQMIYFTIDNKEYSNKTDKNGNANLVINLNPGSYNVDSVFRGNDVYFASSTFSKLVVLPDDNEGNGSNVMDNNQNNTSSSSITKLSTKIVASNLVKYYKDSKKLVITLKDSKNKIVAGRSLSIKLNGKTYKGATDKKGQIKITINLKKGSYAVSIKFAGDKYYKASSKKVTVKVVYPQIKAVKTTVKRNKKLQVKFLTYKGKAIKSQKVTLKIKGKTYTVKTNSKGIASLKIKVKKGTYSVKFGFKNIKTYGKYTKTIKIRVK